MFNNVPEGRKKWYGLRIFKHTETASELKREMSAKKMTKQLKQLKRDLKEQQTILEKSILKSNDLIKQINEIEEKLIDWGYDI